jgi:hypothetical protein
VKTGKRALVTLASASLGLLVSCTPSSPPPPVPSDTSTPSPTTPDPRFGFEITGVYRAQAVVREGTQTIIITVGKPETAASYSKRQSLHCRVPRPQNDLVIPFYVDVRNTSPKGSKPVRIGVSITPAVTIPDSGVLRFDLALDADNQCRSLAPLIEATRTSVSGGQPGSVPHYSRPETTTGQSVRGSYVFSLTSPPDGPPTPVSSMFMRLSPIGDIPVTYRITQLETGIGSKDPLQPGVAGVITSGPDKGAFYAPLQPGINPCTTLTRETGAQMTCDSTITTP